MRPKHLKELLKEAKLPAFLVVNPLHLLYLLGEEVSAGALLVTGKNGASFFVDGRYGEAAERGRRGWKVRDAGSLKRALKSIPVCGCEGENVTLSQKKRWGEIFPGTKFLPVEGIVASFRRSKSADELKSFRRAQKITREMLRRIPAFLRPSVTEREIAWKLKSLAHDLGADELAFDPIVAFGAHSSRPHHHPTVRALKRGDLVQIDVGARFQGYCADQSRVFFTGKITREQERVLSAVLEAKDAATKLVSAGVSTHELDRAARKVLKEHGLEDKFVHSLGHGVGLEIHEGVTLSQKRPSEKLLKDEIVTIEPGVYLKGKFGIRLEDEVIVK